MPMAHSPQMEAVKPEIDVTTPSMPLPDSAIDAINELQDELRRALRAKSHAEKKAKEAQDEVKMAESWAEDMENQWDKKFEKQEKEIKQLKCEMEDQQLVKENLERDLEQWKLRAKEAEDLSVKLDAAEKKATAMESERDEARSAEEAAVEELGLAEKWADQMTRKWKMDLAAKQEEIDELKKERTKGSKTDDSARVTELQGQIEELQNQKKELQANLDNVTSSTCTEELKSDVHEDSEDVKTANESLLNANASLQKDLTEAKEALKTNLAEAKEALKSASAEKRKQEMEAAERSKQKDEKCAQQQKEIENLHRELKSVKGVSNAVAKETKKDDEEKRKVEIRLTQALEHSNELKKQLKAKQDCIDELNSEVQNVKATNEQLRKAKLKKPNTEKAPASTETAPANKGGNAEDRIAELEKKLKEAEAKGPSSAKSKAKKDKGMLDKVPYAAWAVLILALFQLTQVLKSAGADSSSSRRSM